jgi:hypothetical protein
MRTHQERGDFARWGARAQAQAQARAEDACGGCQVSETDAGEFVNAQTGAQIPVPPDPVVAGSGEGPVPVEEVPIPGEGEPIIPPE